MGRFVSIYSHVLILLVHVQMLLALFLNECPDKLMWTLRAKQLCGVEDKYMCLYDTNKRSFRELCKDAPEFHRPGNIFVISGNLKYFAGRQCYSNRYQPHKWWTNGSSECQYIKSSCNGEGQVPYDNGTITRDKKCRCDYTNYYTFVSITRNKCHCDPIEEDCSCYRQRCHEDQVLTPDYDCVGIHEWTGRFICPEYKPPIINDEKHGATLCPTIEKDSYGKINLSSFRIVVSLLSGVFVIFGLVTFTFFKLRKTLKDDMQDYTETFLRDTVGILPLIDYFLEEPSNIECIEGEDATLTCKVRPGNTSVKWFKDGNEIKQNEYYIMSNKQKHKTCKIQLTLKNTKRSDSGEYIVHVGKDSRKVQLTIKGYFLEEPSDIECLEGDDATLTCEVRPGSTPIKWFKDGNEINQTKHYIMSKVEKQHKLELQLTLKDTTNSDSGEYIVQVMKFSRQIQLTIKDLTRTINQLSDDDKIRYKTLIQTEKSEKRYFVRTMIVGKESVGKTCLLRRLLKQDISTVTSTDGVDIVVRRCKINIENGKWIIGKDMNDDKVGRIKRALIPSVENRNTINMQQDSTRNINKGQCDEVSTYKKEKYITPDENFSQGKSEDTHECPLLTKDFTTEAQTDMDNYKERNEPSSLVIPPDLISHVFSMSTEETSSNLYALCELWDFAGQREFYATHQAFLTSSAVYLIVADMRDDISKQGLGQYCAEFQLIGEYVDFWFDSIHCHRTADEQHNNGHFDPPIVLVFTGKDKYDEANFRKREKELNNQLDQVLGLQSKYHHLHKTCYLSNSKDRDEEFEKLQYTIYEAARTMKNWGNVFPLKWILLEHLIDINKNNGKNFINFTDMSKLAKHHDINIQEEDELLLFLRFHHNVGNIIFFESIQDLIILNPQWLADAFRCLVSDRFDSRLHYREDWILFIRQGKISESLITELFKSKNGSLFSGQEYNLRKVMEAFDILIKIENSNYYIMPSQMPSATFDDVCDKFGILTNHCQRTSWLCFKFKFLPPSFFNHLSAWFIRNYYPSKVDGGVALYRGICMFDIDRSGGKKILVTMSTDTIALQVVSFSKEQEGFGSMCGDIYRDVQKLIGDIKDRYKVKIYFTLHFKCSDGDYFKHTFEYENLAIEKECYCIQHKKMHQSDQIYSPWIDNEVDRIPDSMKMSMRQKYEGETEKLAFL